MRMANFGCGPDIKESTEDVEWFNFDRVLTSENIGNDHLHLWNMTQDPHGQMEHTWVESFDGGLINHVLCTGNDYSAHQMLINIHRMLRPGGKLIVIDMDLLKVFKSYQDGRPEDIPIEDGSPDAKLCFAISGYGTRLSLYTPERMKEVLTEAGFRIVKQLDSSEYDARPKESLIFEATK